MSAFAMLLGPWQKLYCAEPSAPLYRHISRRSPTELSRDKAEHVQDTHLHTGSIHLVEDYLAMLDAWSSVFGSALLVAFTEKFTSEPLSLLNSVLAHVGFPRYHWPAARRVPSSGRLTFHPRRSKSVVPRRELGPAWDFAVRAAFSPVIRSFRAVLPCLAAPWPVASARDESAHQLRVRDHALRRRLCGPAEHSRTLWSN